GKTVDSRQTQDPEVCLAGDASRSTLSPAAPSIPQGPPSSLPQLWRRRDRAASTLQVQKLGQTKSAPRLIPPKLARVPYDISLPTLDRRRAYTPTRPLTTPCVVLALANTTSRAVARHALRGRYWDLKAGLGPATPGRLSRQPSEAALL